MRNFSWILLAALFAVSIFVPSAMADPRGIWVTKDGKSLINIGPCRGQQGSRSMLCSKIIWLQKPFNEKGEPLRDKVNTNPRMRRRTILGMPILLNMRPKGRSWEGRVYNPEDGKEYRAEMHPQGRRRLLVKGCATVLFSSVCREQLWQRVSVGAIRAIDMPVEPVISSNSN